MKRGYASFIPILLLSGCGAVSAAQCMVLSYPPFFVWRQSFPQMNMTPNNVQPMSQRQADALRNEWALLLKKGYASQWTPAQKMERQDEIAALLQQAGQALPRGLNQQDLLGADDVFPPRAAP